MKLFILIVCGLAITCDSFTFQPSRRRHGGPVYSPTFPTNPGGHWRFRRESDDENVDDIEEDDSHSLKRRLVDLEEAVGQILKRQTDFFGNFHHDATSGITSGSARAGHTFGNTRLGGSMDFNDVGGRGYSGSLDHKFNGGKSSLGAKISKDLNGLTNYGASLDHSFWNGNGKLGLKVNHNSHSGTSVGLGGEIRFKKRDQELHRDKKKTTIHGGFDRKNGKLTGNAGIEHTFNGGRSKIGGSYGYGGPGRHSFGASFSHAFGKRLVDPEEAKRQTTIHGGFDRKNGKLTGNAGIEHTFNGGRSKFGGSYGYGGPGRHSFGGSFSHTFGKRLVDPEEAKRQTTIHGGFDRKNGKLTGNAGIEHTFNGGRSKIGGSYGYGGPGRHSFGASFSHTFGKRLVDPEEAKREIAVESMPVGDSMVIGA